SRIAHPQHDRHPQRPGAGHPRLGLYAADAARVDAQRDQPGVRGDAAGAPAPADLGKRQLELEAAILIWLEKTMRTLVLDVPDDEAEALEREAARLGKSVSEVIVELVRQLSPVNGAYDVTQDPIYNIK